MTIVSGLVTVLAFATMIPVQGWLKGPSVSGPNATQPKAERMACEPIPAQNQIGSDEEFEVGIWNECHVDSRFDGYIRVYINGVYRGTIPPWGDIYPIVRDFADEPTYLYAESTCGLYCWSRTVRGDFSNYHWILRP